MSRNKAKDKRKRQKELQRKQAKKTRALTVMSRALAEGLDEADQLLRRRRWQKARELIEDLDKRFPRRREVLSRLREICYRLNDIRDYQFACERLLSIEPDDSDLHLMLGGAYMTNARPALALKTFRRFLERWPNDERAEGVRRTVGELEEFFDEQAAEWGWPLEDCFETAVQHEQILCLLDQGKYDDVCETAGQLLRRHPRFVPALNNLSHASSLMGRADQAIAAAQQVLSIEPDNFHALANLTRYLCLLGRTEESRSFAQRLKAAESTKPEVWLKKAEGLTFLGDDQGVLDVLGEAESRGAIHSTQDDALLYHLAAVAAMRLGDEDRARRYWLQAVRVHPGLDVAQENLQDLKRPIGERNAPWAFQVNHWLSKSLMEKLTARLQGAERRGKDGSEGREARRFLEETPAMAAVLPILLDRGDSFGRELALRIGGLAKTPELLEALRDLVLGQRGPDKLRYRAAEIVRQAGLLPAGPTRMWVNGEWTDMLLLCFEVHEEPNLIHQPQVEEWASQGFLALNEEDDPETAEQLFRRALEVEPEALDLLNNLATCCKLQGRLEEASRMIHEIHRRDPDYLFGRVNMALEYLEADEPDKAREMLQPLLMRTRLHRTEFSSLCKGEIELCMHEDKIEGARCWFKIWQQCDADNPELPRWESHVGLGSLWRSRPWL